MDHLGPRIMYRASSLVTFIGSSLFAMILLRERAPPEQSGLIVPTEDTDLVLDSLESLQEEEFEEEMELREFRHAKQNCDPDDGIEH